MSVHSLYQSTSAAPALVVDFYCACLSCDPMLPLLSVRRPHGCIPEENHVYWVTKISHT